MTFHVPEQYRIKKGVMASTSDYGNNGAFHVKNFFIMASDSYLWEHVSVSLKKRTPHWSEMCYIKDIFWDEEDCVMQLHPPKSEYINNNPNTLHLWRPIGLIIPMPPVELV